MAKRSLSAGVSVGCLIVLGAGSVALGARQAAGPVTMEQVTTAAKHFFRDTAEFPLLQKMTMTVTNASGRVIKRQDFSGDYVFHGYSQRTKTSNGQVHGEISIWDAMRGAKVIKESVNSDIWTMVAGDELLAEPGTYALASDGGSSGGGGLVKVKLNPVRVCPAFVWQKQAKYYLPDFTCGSSEFQLKGDLSFQRFSIDVAGLPAAANVSPFGKCVVERYHAEVEFQSVMLAGEKEPFIVPKKVTASIETDKGKILIVSKYEAKERK